MKNNLETFPQHIPAGGLYTDKDDSCTSFCPGCQEYTKWKRDILKEIQEISKMRDYIWISEILGKEPPRSKNAHR